MTKKEFHAFVNKEYDVYESRGLTLDQVARDIERRIQEAKNMAELLNMFRNDVSAHVTPRTKDRLNEIFDRQQHTHKCVNGPPQLE